MDQITLRLPPPDPRLHAHNTGHWRTKAEPIRELRQLACITCMDAAKGQRWDRAIVHYHFVFQDRKRRDLANAIQSLKPAIDGVKDAGLIPDDDWQHLAIGRITATVNPRNAGTILIFDRLD